MSTATKISVKNVNFRKFIGSEGNARVLGFLNFILVVPTLNEGVIELPYSDLKVRVNAKGDETLCAPTRRYKNAQGEHRSSSAYRFSDKVYADLVTHFFAREDVVGALVESNARDASSDDGEAALG